MATNKNQHFVPRCHLKQFASDANGNAIRIYNVDRDKFIENAPIKNQCSRDYFYGKDPSLDAAIRTLEGAYGTAVGKILNPQYTLTDEDRETLRIFWLMQYLRTEAASKRTVEITENLRRAMGTSDLSLRLEIRDAVQMAMRIFAETIGIVSDLKVCLVCNHSHMPFVTSDDPAILTNRWALHNSKRTGRSFGLNSAGNLLLLPLTPRIMFLGYDGDVHSISHDRGWVHFRRDGDADAFNQHQYLNCRANIFVRDREHLPIVRAAFLRTCALRPAARHRLHYAVLDRTHGDHSHYAVVDNIPDDDHEALVHSQAVYPAPSAWPQLLTWRSGACAFYNGTGIGYVRRAFVSSNASPPFRKIHASVE